MSANDKMPYVAKHDQAYDIYEKAMEEYNRSISGIPNKSTRLSN